MNGSPLGCLGCRPCGLVIPGLCMLVLSGVRRVCSGTEPQIWAPVVVTLKHLPPLKATLLTCSCKPAACTWSWHHLNREVGAATPWIRGPLAHAVRDAHFAHLPPVPISNCRLAEREYGRCARPSSTRCYVPRWRWTSSRTTCVWDDKWASLGFPARVCGLLGIRIDGAASLLMVLSPSSRSSRLVSP